MSLMTSRRCKLIVILFALTTGFNLQAQTSNPKYDKTLADSLKADVLPMYLPFSEKIEKKTF